MTKPNPNSIYMKKYNGFTIIDLLVVISIIGFLTTFAIFQLNSTREKAKKVKAGTDLKVLQESIDRLANDTDQWPNHDVIDVVCNGPQCGSNEICGLDKNADSPCAAQLSSPAAGIISTDGSFPKWAGPYIQTIPKDPWGYEYYFDSDYLIGADKKPCGCSQSGPPYPANSCFWAVVVGSYGPNNIGHSINAYYDCDDVIRIIRSSNSTGP